MPNRSNSTTDSNKSQIYLVKLEGQLDQRWTDWFDGMQIVIDEYGNTILSGPIKDQAELQGLIKKIYNLGLTLVSVNPQEKKGDD